MSAERRPPNIVLINCDDLGYGDLGCYGSHRNDTPVLDRMAAEGLRLTDFSMASPVCSPSRAALLTGCYPPRIGFGAFEGLPVLFPGQGVGLHPDEVTIADILRGCGYATKHVGKWHCGDQPPFLPTRHGFDGSYGIPYSNDMGRQPGPNYMQMLHDGGVRVQPEYPPLPLLRDDVVIEEQPDQASLTARFVEESVRFVRDSAAHRQPFFLYLAHIYVHLPIYVQDRFARESRNGSYGGAVACVDWAAGVLLHELRRLGIDDDTLVLFTSDNGSRGRDGGSNAPLRGAKGTTWEGGMRVPCIVRWPGRIAPGGVSDALAASIDLFPTLIALAGGDVPSDRTIDGVDLGPFLLDGAPSPRRTFWHYAGNDLEAVRTARWKLHVARKGEEVRELYDLRADPGETTDVRSEHPDVVAELEAEAEQARTEMGDARLGRTGRANRPAGTVDDPRPLTTYDPEHPYYLAEYDLADRG